MKKSLLIITFLLSLCTSAQIYVNASATGANNGTSWTNAFTSLQSALNQTNVQDIWIAAGTYKPGSTLNSTFVITRPFTIYGGFDGTETSLSQRDFATNITRLSGDLNDNDTLALDYNLTERSDNAYRVVLVNSQNVILDGITISNANLRRNGNTTGINEGSAIVVQANTIIRNCVIERNVSEYGGTISIGNNNTNSVINIENTVIRNNQALYGAAIYSSSGIDSELRIVNSLVHDNTCRSLPSSFNAVNNMVWMENNGTAPNSLTVVNSTFTGNVYVASGVKDIFRVDNNLQPDFLRLYNNIFYFNSPGTRAINSNGQFQELTIENNNDENSFANVNTSNAVTTLSNNISSDPLFVNNTSDFGLLTNSPSINTGNNSFYNNNSSETTDLAGNVRIQNSTIDMGAYEGINVPQAATIIYVDKDATGSNDGTSWADAYTNLQNAIQLNAASEFWIAEGTYTPGSQLTSTFDLNTDDTKLYGGFNGTETMLSQRNPSTHVTILSGDLNNNDTGVSYYGTDRSDNCYHVITINAANCIVDGVTITSGQANGGTAIDQEGAAISVNNGNFTLNRSRIEKCATVRGGAIRAIDQVGTLDIENTVFTENLGNIGPVLYARAGGGNFFVRMTNCLLDNNTKESIGNPNGIGIVWIRQDGGGVIGFEVINTTIVHNKADNSTISTPVFSISQINGSNRAANAYIYNSIFQNNQNITGGNTQPLTSVGNGTSMNNAQLYAVQYSLDESGFSNIGNNGSTFINTNNVSGAPLFTSATDYTLQSSSPAIDTGINSLVPSNITTDLAGNNRIANNTVDMGAYEFGATASIEESANLKFTLYPNPVSYILNVDCGDSAFAKAEIFNLQGQRVATSKTKEINVQELKTGMYLIKVETTDGAVASQQFIKN